MPTDRDRPLKVVLKIAGMALALASLIFVARLLLAHAAELRRLVSHPSLWLAILGASGVYAANGCLLAAAWRTLVGLDTTARLPLRTALSVYGRAQLAKYLPGNTLHLIGRHALGAQEGVAHRPLLIAAILELALIALAATALAGFALNLAGDALAELLPGWASPGLVASAWLLGAAALVFATIKTTKGADDLRSGAVRKLGRVFGAYLLYCIVLGTGMIPVMWAVAGVWAPVAIISSVALAWVLGLVTPGAPSGIGVREAALALLLAPLIGDPEAVLVSLAFRVATVLGDLGFFLVAVSLEARRTDSGD
jgi:hypothetical protein